VPKHVLMCVSCFVLGSYTASLLFLKFLYTC